MNAGVMGEPTPAQRQAEFLTALARHLRAHPHLPEVNISSLFGYGWKLQVLADAGGLVAWAHSFGGEQLTALPIDDADWSAVHVSTELSGVGVDAYTRVDAFPRDVTALTVADLEHFAEHGTLPGVGGSDG